MPYQIYSINPKTAALIVVDMENDFVAPGAPMEAPAARAMVPVLRRALQFCRNAGVHIIYTTHVHRADGSDAGLFGHLWPPIARRSGFVDGTAGTEIYPEVAPAAGEHVIRKHRYSAFFGTDLDIILRQWDVDTVIIAGVTTENSCHATACDAMFRNYRVAFLADATATLDYPDTGYGALSAQQVHSNTLAILSVSAAHVMTAQQMMQRISARIAA